MTIKLSFWARANLGWAETLESAQTAQRLGYRGIWIADHFMPVGAEPTDGPTHESMTLLSALAACVPDVRLGTMVIGNTYRNPCVLAKQAATIDVISGGRMVLGIGAGWQENEHRAYGIPFNTFGWRFDCLEESVQIIRSLFLAGRTTYKGDHYTVVDAPLDPKPVQERLPILVGGGGPNRTLRIVARYADEWNIWGTPELLAEKGAVLSQRCEEEGRDPASVHRTAVALLLLNDDPAAVAKLRERDLGRPSVIGSAAEVADTLRAYEAAGVHEFIVPDFTFQSPAHRAEVLEAMATVVLPQVA
jgi:F420-dependent oxidoreductase-like protein